MNTMQHPDVVIRGSGVIGLALALELRLRGRNVLVLERQHAGLASRAAAGMLAAHDPHHPPALQPLADLALDLYPAFLKTVRKHSGHAVRIQTGYVLDQAEHGHPGEPGTAFLPALAPLAGDFMLHAEQSLDPRDLHTALRTAAQHTGVHFQQSEGAENGSIPGGSVAQSETTGLSSAVTKRPFPRPFHCVDCTGAWSPAHTRPAKGQMLRVRLPPDTLRLPNHGNAVVRTGTIYLVPRLDGTTVIGATVEDAGFDLSTPDDAIQQLRDAAAVLIPAAATASEVERWAGLRPRTPDDLPILGQLPPESPNTNGPAKLESVEHAEGENEQDPDNPYATSRSSDVGLTPSYVANGLFRNGILLAPAVARLMAQLLSGEPLTIPMDDFSPTRPTLQPRSSTKG